MPIDPTKPPDDQDIPAFPAYLRGVWASIAQATVPAYFSVWRPGPVTMGLNAGSEVIISATPGLPTLVQTVLARVKQPSTSGDISVDVLINGINIVGAPVIIPVSQITSVALPAATPNLHNGDLFTMAVTATGTGAMDLSVHLLCAARVNYP